MSLRITGGWTGHSVWLVLLPVKEDAAPESTSITCALLFKITVAWYSCFFSACIYLPVLEIANSSYSLWVTVCVFCGDWGATVAPSLVFIEETQAMCPLFSHWSKFAIVRVVCATTSETYPLISLSLFHISRACFSFIVGWLCTVWWTSVIFCGPAGFWWSTQAFNFAVLAARAFPHVSLNEFFAQPAGGAGVLHPACHRQSDHVA